MWYKVHNHLVHMKFPTAVTPKPRLVCHAHHLAYLHIIHRTVACKYPFFVRTFPMWTGVPVIFVATQAWQAFYRLAVAHYRSQGQARLS